MGTSNRSTSALGRTNANGKARSNQTIVYIFGAYQKCGCLFKPKSKEVTIEEAGGGS
jgi:hypothetical protein